MASHIAKTAQQQVLERLAAHRASAGAGAGAGVSAGAGASSGGLGRGGVARATNGATMAAAAGAANHNMSSHVTWQHIKRVQHLIERCLQSHMTQVLRCHPTTSTLNSYPQRFNCVDGYGCYCSACCLCVLCACGRASCCRAVMCTHAPQTEVVSRLADAHIQPNLTLLVWQKLEEQNPSFFYNYYIRLRLKEQIVAFNQLVSKGPASPPLLPLDHADTVLPPTHPRLSNKWR